MGCTEIITGHKVIKTSGSRGEFGRSDKLAVAKVVVYEFDGFVNPKAPPREIIVSIHNSREAAERACRKREAA